MNGTELTPKEAKRMGNAGFAPIRYNIAGRSSQRGVLAATYSASSSIPEHGDETVFDDDYTTYRQAPESTEPQWLMVDLGKVETFNEIHSFRGRKSRNKRDDLRDEY